MDIKQIEALLNQEIAWCQANPTAEKSVDFQIGFIAGLQQAKFLMKEASKPNGVVIEKECAETGCKADIYRETIRRLEKRNLDLASDVGKLSAKVIAERERAANAEYALKSEHGQLMAAQKKIAALEQAIDGRAKVSEYQGSIIHALEETVNEARTHFQKIVSYAQAEEAIGECLPMASYVSRRASSWLSAHPVTKPLET